MYWAGTLTINALSGRTVTKKYESVSELLH
jgi:hypothetical protein